MQGGVGVRVFEADDQERVIELLQAAFGGWPRYVEGVTPEDFFRWKHVTGAFGPSIGLVAEIDGAIVGFYALTTWRLRIAGRPVRTNRSVDLAVDPTARRRGVSMALIEASPEHFPPDVIFSWGNPNELSRGGVLKAGRPELDGLPRFASLGLAPLGWIGRALRKGSTMRKQLPVRARGAAEALLDGPGITRLLESVPEPSDRYVTAKDLEFLRWRYGHLSEYRALTAEVAGRCAGLAIFRVHRHGRFWISHVSELLVEHGQPRIARRLLRQVRRAAATDLVTCAFPSRSQAARCGFLDVPGGKRLMTNPLRSGIAPDPALAASWELSLGDIELL